MKVNYELTASSAINMIKATLYNVIFGLKKVNFKEYYPGYNFDEILPELKIGEDGFPTFDAIEVINGFDFNLENISIVSMEDFYEVYYEILESNEDFNMIRISEVLDGLKMSDNHNDMELLEIIQNASIPSDIRSIISINEEEEEEVMKSFKTKNATMIFEINGEQNSFDKVTFKLGGAYSRFFQKPGFNLKIRGNKDLHGRSQFKLRADLNDPTIMRTKLISDIHNRLGLKSVSSTYVQLYINDEFMGLYTFNDDYKLSWIEEVYGEKNAKNLYKCDSMIDLLPEYSYGCINENEEIDNDTEWIEFLTAIENAKSAADLEDIFEIDHFLYEMAIDYLTGAYDHIQNTHNYYMYKQPNGKWIYLSHDFDHDFGQVSMFFNAPITITAAYGNIHLIEVLIFNDSARFEKILSEVISKVFNPSTLYSHIDEIKEYIKPYVILDKTPDANGNYPGHFNTGGIDGNFSLEQWDAYSEFTNGYSDMESYGLKYWILMRYRYTCDYYSLECDSTYLDENYEYPVVEELNVNYNYDFGFDGWYSTYYSYEMPTETSIDYNYTEVVFETPTESPSEASNETIVETSTESPTETYSDSFIETQTNSSTEPTPTSIDVEYISDDEALEVEEEVTAIDESDSEEEEDLVTITATATNEIKTITKTVTMIRSTIIN
ncbi:hypothetical protein BCR36DRAFT_364100 [Piromyces finnis]|uniref:Coth-domain-containing protein n=1 Tax=Piromyces finnis TaxID=1754191 RepID=A0A1Y1UVN3_9FUNG|nr:hypothetical protein BCR36DRAFT_364100 [Piromyces finnis]|eukprot:ORX41537.1 hypothetical protein BCR36DRAFT_364100 [Piromyces finnis]